MDREIFESSGSPFKTTIKIWLCLLLTLTTLELQVSARSPLLERKVSVKSPQRVSSVINHFNPAGHVYAASGEAAFYGGSSQSSTPIRTIDDSNENTFNYNLPAKVQSGFQLQKSVSVKSPPRTSSVISHFNPAGHVYAASGNVNINRGFSSKPSYGRTPKNSPVQIVRKVETYKPAPVRKQVNTNRTPLRENVFKLEKTVSVKSPQRVSSVINHFSPAGHQYAATGGVIINRGSSKPRGSVYAAERIRIPSVTVQKKINPVVTYEAPTVVTKKTVYEPQRIDSIRGASDFNLKKSVSVKSPTRVSSVINHFNPAGHKYEATGNVVINRNSPPQQPPKIIRNYSPTKITTTVREYNDDSMEEKKVKSAESIVRREQKKVNYETKRVVSDFNLKKTVSVKSPQRVSSVISHFNPAGHHYAATGSVVINRGSSHQRGSGSGSGSGYSGSRTVVEAKPIVVDYSPPKPKRVKPAYVSVTQAPVYKAPRVKTNQGSAFNLKKTVSVKSPQRISSVINHFNPAGHQYAATGNVVINRGSRPQQVSRTKYVKIETPVETPKYSPPRKVYVQKVAVDDKSTEYSGTRRVQKNYKVNSSGSSGNFNLKKTVSVKSPQRVSSVISHFSPAGHHYAATGSVVINRGSTQGSSKRGSTTYQEKSSVRPVKTVVKYDDSVEEIVEKPVYVAPKRPAPVTNYKIKESSGFNLKKSVSVKSPQRVSSVINHFNPAGHDYEATGNVAINRGSESLRPSQVQYTSSPVKVNIPVRKDQYESTRKAKKTFVAVVKSEKSNVDYSEPKRVNVQTISDPSKFKLTKTVSVKYPQRVSSVISHFTPAGHKYAATGSVLIDRDSSRQKVSVGQSNYKTRKPLPNPGRVVIYKEPKRVEKVTYKVPKKVEKVYSAPVTPLSKPVTYKSSNAASRDEFSLKKSVSVKSPQRASSVISHFNPAGHKYAATGHVVINRAPKTTQIVKTTTYTAPSKVVDPVIKVQTQFTSPKKEVKKPSPTYSTQGYNIGSGGLGFKLTGQNKVTNSNFNLKKSVSVKSPQRVSSVISHFSPAGHNYEATGNVVINRGSSAVNTANRNVNTYKINTAQKSTSKTSFDVNNNFKSSVVKNEDSSEGSYETVREVKINRNQYTTNKQIPVRTAVKKTKLAEAPKYTTKIIKTIKETVKPVVNFNSGAYSQKPSRLNLERTVSVASPQRTSSVISHFTPAGHKYTATGRVVINRQSNTAPKTSRPKYSSVKKEVTKNTYPESEEERIEVPVKKVETVYKPAPSPPKRVDYTFSNTEIKKSSNSFELEREVSVKSPERVTSVISHFNPAGHVYEASGNVKINRGNDYSVKVPEPVQTYKPEPIQTYQPEPVQTYQPEPVPTYHPAPQEEVESEVGEAVYVKQEPVTYTPEKVETKPEPFDFSFPQTLGYEFSIPEPVGYDFPVPAQLGLYLPPKPSVVVKNIPTPPENIENSSPEVVEKPKAPISLNTDYENREPISSDRQSRFKLERKVTVKNPKRVTSVIDHFNPAQHVYEATGSVTIDRQN